jgi:hypothetical protein
MACLAFGRRAALGNLLAVGVNRLVGKHQWPPLSGLEPRFNGIEKHVRGRIRRAELAALLEAAPGNEECGFDRAANRPALPTPPGS